MKHFIQLLISMMIAASFVPLAAFAEPPKKAQDASTQSAADIEIAVEKLERDKSKQSNAAPPTDADGDGYGDAAKAVAGDPIPDIDISVKAGDGNAQGPQKSNDGKAEQLRAKEKRRDVNCKKSEKDCNSNR
ncbi:hypothetical protein ACQ5ES_07595 [Pseudidiomarina sp. E22-M8]|uniref:hypothetical protein n=1 Tax=Pseudidiomarina sp. E22-M8 TaxID=3424768 RepID=UPI00403C42B0